MRNVLIFFIASVVLCASCVRASSLDGVIGHCRADLCLIRDVANRASKASSVPAGESFEMFYGGRISAAAKSLGMADCDLLPIPACWSDVLTFRQRIYLSGSRVAAGCVDVTGTQDDRKNFVSISIYYEYENEEWKIRSVNRYQSLSDNFTLSDVLHSFCAPPKPESAR